MVRDFPFQAERKGFITGASISSCPGSGSFHIRGLYELRDSPSILVNCAAGVLRLSGSCPRADCVGTLPSLVILQVGSAHSF